MRCPSCGGEAAEGERFCAACGAELKWPVTPVSHEGGQVSETGATHCDSCGVANEPEARFCLACGSPLATPGPAADPSQSADPHANAGLACICGAANDPDAAFCHACGRRLASGEDVEGAAALGITRAATLPSMGPAIPPQAASEIDSAAPVAARKGSRRLVLVVVAIIVAMLVSGGAAFLILRPSSAAHPESSAVAADQTSASPQPKVTASDTATSDGGESAWLTQVEALVKQAGQGRHGIATATAAYAGHKISSSDAAQTIQGVVNHRRDVLAQLSSMSVWGDPRAAACMSAFKQAMKCSILADEHYLDWVHGSGSINAADPANKRAGYWKARFVRLYNGLAGENGMRHDWAVVDI